MILKKLSRGLDYLRTPGSLAARFNGIPLDFFKVVSDLARRGISPRVILDIGASNGEFSRAMNYVFPEAQIFAFEPRSDLYRELVNVSERQPRITSYQTALGAGNGTVELIRNSYHYSSSVLPMLDLHREAFPYAVEGGAEIVPVTRLDEYAEIVSGETPLLVKVDVQGYEDKVIEGGRHVLSQCDYLIIELSIRALYRNQLLFSDLYPILTGLGFRYQGDLSRLPHPRTGEILQVDAFFTRTQ